jgi:voltage-gated potassium channel
VKTRLKTILAIFFLIVLLLTLATAFYSFITGATLYDGFISAISRVFGTGEGTIGMNLVSFFFTFVAAWLIYYLLNFLIEIFIDFSVKEVFLMNKVKRLKNHYIICGSGRVGFNVAQRLKERGEKFVIIDKESEVADEMADRYDFLVITGDATDEYNLNKAGIGKSKGVICALGSNEDNFFLILTAKELNPNLKVVSRAETEKIAKKMQAAGADGVITPEVLSGRQMADKIVAL